MSSAKRAPGSSSRWWAIVFRSASDGIMWGKERLGTFRIKTLPPKSQIESFSRASCSFLYVQGNHRGQANASWVNRRCRRRVPSGGPPACWSCWAGGHKTRFWQAPNELWDPGHCTLPPLPLWDTVHYCINIYVQLQIPQDFGFTLSLQSTLQLAEL